MQSFIFILTLLSLSASGQTLNLELNDQWKFYMKIFNKTYNNPYHELERREIWEANLKYIQKHNLEYDLGIHTFTLGMNQFADMTHEEFKRVYLPRIFNVTKNRYTYMFPMNTDCLPESVNWKEKGYVTPVKNQGKCGSCWAFSSTGSLEGQYFRKEKQLINLSEQQLVDCSTEDKGCNGGLMTDAFNYIKTCGGIESEDYYPYQGINSVCQFDQSKIAVTCTGYQNIKKNETALAQAVAHVGPISIAIDASQESFRFYKDGVYNEPKCTETLDHAVLLVGYNNNENGKYWIVKNSWGITWGQDGYIWMSKDGGNQCGIASMASFPLV